MSNLIADYLLLLPPLVAGLIILSTHVPLGRQVISRGIIFIDLAIAQVAGLGVIAATCVGLKLGTWQLQVFALASALLGAVFLMQIERIAGRFQEAIIGITFVLAATASIMLLSSHPHAGEEIHNLLIGQILWVDWLDLIYPAIVALLLLSILFIYPYLLKGKGFYLLFAVAITCSVQLIGIYLVFASLILPALAVVGEGGNKRALVSAYILGVSSYLIGLWLSTITDLPSGAVIVWMMAVFSGAYYVCRRIVYGR